TRKSTRATHPGTGAASPASSIAAHAFAAVISPLGLRAPSSSTAAMRPPCACPCRCAATASRRKPFARALSASTMKRSSTLRASYGSSQQWLSSQRETVMQKEQGRKEKAPGKTPEAKSTAKRSSSCRPQPNGKGQPQQGAILTAAASTYRDNDHMVSL